MKNIISNLKLAIISLSLILVSHEVAAQTTGVNALPPIISFILEDNESNSPPVNTVPTEVLQLNISDPFAFPVIEVPLNVDDIDGNLSSIEVTSTPGSIVSVELTGDTVLGDGIDQNNFIISGPQEDLITSIYTLVFVTFDGVGDYTITILSTDSDGGSDEDIINIEVIDDGSGAS